jgi:hypothetical protein
MQVPLAPLRAAGKRVAVLIALHRCHFYTRYSFEAYASDGGQRILDLFGASKGRAESDMEPRQAPATVSGPPAGLRHRPRASPPRGLCAAPYSPDRALP